MKISQVENKIESRLAAGNAPHRLAEQAESQLRAAYDADLADLTANLKSRYGAAYKRIMASLAVHDADINTNAADFTADL